MHSMEIASASMSRSDFLGICAHMWSEWLQACNRPRDPSNSRLRTPLLPTPLLISSSRPTSLAKLWTLLEAQIGPSTSTCHVQSCDDNVLGLCERSSQWHTSDAVLMTDLSHQLVFLASLETLHLLCTTTDGSVMKSRRTECMVRDHGWRVGLRREVRSTLPRGWECRPTLPRN